MYARDTEIDRHHPQLGRLLIEMTVRSVTVQLAHPAA